VCEGSKGSLGGGVLGVWSLGLRKKSLGECARVVSVSVKVVSVAEYAEWGASVSERVVSVWL